MWARFKWIALVVSAAIFCGCKSPPVAHSKPKLEEKSIAPLPQAVETFEAAWEILRDTHFDTNFNGVDWNAVHAKYLPRIESAKSGEQVRDAIQEMLDLLGVSHLMILPGSPQRRALLTATNQPASPTAPTRPPPSGEMGGLGIEVRVLDNQIVVFRVEPHGPAAEAGVKPGWILKTIDGDPAIDPTIKTDISARQREFLLWHNAATSLKGPVSEKCVLEVITDSGETKTISISRAREVGQPAKLGNLPTMFTRVETTEITMPSEKRVGYLRFNLWMLPAIPPVDRFIDANRNADGLIVDLRGNLGGIGGMVMGAAGHFVNQRGSLGTMKMRENELNFVVFPRRVDTQARATNTFQGKLAILVDAVSLSSSELFAGGMQEMGRARIFGQPTGGQALPAIADRLPNGDILYHAVADFTTPKGRRIEGAGVTPDEIVPLRLDALRAGKDEPLAAALRWIDSTPQPR